MMKPLSMLMLLLAQTSAAGAFGPLVETNCDGLIFVPEAKFASQPGDRFIPFPGNDMPSTSVELFVTKMLMPGKYGRPDEKGRHYEVYVSREAKGSVIGVVRRPLPSLIVGSCSF